VRIRIFLTGLMCLFACKAFSQWPEDRLPGIGSSRVDPGSGLVHGQIYGGDALTSSLMVELVAQDRISPARASLEPDGSFEFRGLPAGSYQLRLTGAGGRIAYQESVLVTGGYQNISVQVPPKKKITTGADSVVSIRQLQHKIPARAQKEYDKGKAASIKGDQLAALDHFQKAADMDPAFADAFNGIGVTDMAMGQFQQAADQFRKAIDLVPDHLGAVANLSVVLCRLDQYHESELMARRALKLDPGLMKVRYVLGFNLLIEGLDKAEALDNLQRAASEIPKARLLSAQILADSGRNADAAEQIEEYLRSASGDGMDRQKIEAWLARLRQ
jgi:tetratricopeptide (TPR) repeat protein